MPMNLNITLPSNVIQNIQSAPNEAVGDSEITKTCTAAALSAVKQLPYKLQPQDVTPKTALAATSAAIKRPSTSSDGYSPIILTIVSAWLGRDFAGYEFRVRSSMTTDDLREFMEEKGVSSARLRFVRNGRTIPDHTKLAEVSSRANPRQYVMLTSCDAGRGQEWR